MRAPITTFAAYSHAELERMLRAGDPETVRAAADLWRQVTRSLRELGDDVHSQLIEFSPMWQGGAADQYKVMMAEFVEGVDDTCELLASTRDLVYSAAEALRRAQAEFPAVVVVPELSTTATTLLTWPGPAAVALWDTLTDEQRLQAGVELRQHQGLTGQDQVAQRDAVAIMNELAVHYLDVEDSIPALPVAGEAPRVPTTLAAAQALATAHAGPQPVPPDGQAPSALFGDMYKAGSFAAGAAVLGRFQLGQGWLADRASGASAATATPVGMPSSGSGGGLGGGAGGGGAIGAAPEPPRANPVLTGGGGAGVANPALLGGLPSTGAGVSAAETSGGMFPPMYPPMGGGGEGAGGRRPPWLVETEPVFGEAVPVTPTVIGELPPEPAGTRPWRPVG